MSRPPGHQQTDNCRRNEQRWNIAEQVPAMLRIGKGLECHDAGVHDARPHRKPDNAGMPQWVPRRAQQEDAQGEVDADEHLFVVRVVG